MVWALAGGFRARVRQKTRKQTKAAALSTEPIADPARAEGTADPASAGAAAAVPARCDGCGAPLASDQRYCLECGEPRVPMSSFLLAGATQSPNGQGGAPGAPPAPPQAQQGASRNNALSLLAFVGVLLLAMGVGVLIGRAGNSKPVTEPPPVVTVSSPSSGSGAASSEAAFTGTWPSGTSGYTVQLQTLAEAGTTLSAVESAKSSATAKGAKAVGAIKSEEFSSLPSGNYVIYSGVYHTRAEATKALAALKKSFPGASVVHVSGSSGGAGGSGGSGGSGGAGNSSGSSGASSKPKPASKSVLNNLDKAKGKNYEEKSKNLPDVVETG